MFIPKDASPPTDPAVLAQLKSLSHQIDKLHQENDLLAAKTRELDLRLKACGQENSEHNSTARLINATTSAVPLNLVPLHSPKTNSPIPHFPRSEKEIKMMSTLDVISVLKALDVDYTGPAGMKKQRLKQECGLGGRQTS